MEQNEQQAPTAQQNDERDYLTEQLIAAKFALSGVMQCKEIQARSAYILRLNRAALFINRLLEWHEAEQQADAKKTMLNN